MRAVASGFVFAALASALSFDPLRKRQSNDPTSFDWYALAPSENISWTPCFDGFQCARLSLPLDHATPAGPKTHIALQMLPATDKANYKGSILINPGGPGGSGTLLALQDGASFQRLFGPAFDILGFDPRGTGATVPLAQCFPSAAASDAFLVSEVQMLLPHDGSVPLAQARDDATGALCAQALGGSGQEEIGASAEAWGAGRFMDSRSVATDMLRIVEALGQEKLLYYGLSYGTLLGQYFAALYPDRVGRMIVDGVVDGAKWQRGQVGDAVVDADKVMGAFFANCARAGPQRCAIWEQSAHAVAARAERILAGLGARPIGLPASASGTTVVTEAAVRNLIFHALYSPLDGFPLVATGLRAVETRNVSLLAQLSWFSASAGLPPWLQTNQAIQAIGCGEFPRQNRSLAADVAAVREGNALSEWSGRFDFTRQRLTCGAWAVRAKAPYTGPVAQKLAVPVLAVSNKFDPVTSLSAAHATVARFQPGMRLLVQNTVGHTATLSLGRCVAQAMATYMNTGEVPAVGTVCQPDVVPLVDDGSSL